MGEQLFQEHPGANQLWETHSNISYLPLLIFCQLQIHGKYKVHFSIVKILAIIKQEVSLKKINVEGYRAVGSLLNTKMIAFSLRTFCCCFCCYLLISVNGETYKSAIKRLIKIQMHHVVRKHITATVTDKKFINK